MQPLQQPVERENYYNVHAQSVLMVIEAIHDSARAFDDQGT